MIPYFKKDYITDHQQEIFGHYFNLIEKSLELCEDGDFKFSMRGKYEGIKEVFSLEGIVNDKRTLCDEIYFS